MRVEKFAILIADVFLYKIFCCLGRVGKIFVTKIFSIERNFYLLVLRDLLVLRYQSAKFISLIPTH